jgi:hypothetical protein
MTAANGVDHVGHRQRDVAEEHGGVRRDEFLVDAARLPALRQARAVCALAVDQIELAVRQEDQLRVRPADGLIGEDQVAFRRAADCERLLLRNRSPGYISSDGPGRNVSRERSRAR